MNGTADRTPLQVRALGAQEEFAADFVLAGSGVLAVAADVVTFAERTGLGVLNAFTAKGLFRWDSPFHLGTGCLQERDLALAGAGPDSAVLVVGVDTDECHPALLAAAGVDPAAARWRSVSPKDLLAAADRVTASWGGPPQHPPQPALFKVLWDIAQPLYVLGEGPLNPARAAADIALALGAEGVVCAEPGTAGWWVARTVPTTRLGSVAVPAIGGPGTAVARALVTAQRGNPAVAVVEGPLSAEAQSVIEYGHALGLPFVVEIWGDEGDVVDAAEHQERAAAALATPGVTVMRVPVDWSATAELTAGAGPLVAWS